MSSSKAYDVTPCDMSCDYHVMCLFIVNKKENKIKKKRNIKSRKIDKIKRKMLVSKAFHNSYAV